METLKDLIITLQKKMEADPNLVCKICVQGQEDFAQAKVKSVHGNYMVVDANNKITYVSLDSVTSITEPKAR